MSSMRVRLFAAKLASALSTWGLKRVFKRPAASLPGRLALKIDPQVIFHVRQKLRSGSIVVSGTNGKTTVTNLLADTVQESGKTLICNRSGANLSFGVASALLQSPESDWGVFECDEMWLAKIMPQLEPTYFLLLNLFSDQLDRVGEVGLVQSSIVSALTSSPKTIFIFNADDPLCAEIAERVPNESLSYGVEEEIPHAQAPTGFIHICQTCRNKLHYQYRQYEQLGSYRCSSCGFVRPKPEYTARGIKLEEDILSFTMQVPESTKATPSHGNEDPASHFTDPSSPSNASCPKGQKGESRPEYAIKAPSGGSYMVYNFLAAGAGAHALGCPFESFERVLTSFSSHMGRLQTLYVQGNPVLLNLAKNPAGFNQSLEIAMRDQGPKVLVFYINNNKGDGHDVSWLWDVRFEDLASQEDTTFYAGGLCKEDVRLRLKYAGLDAELVESPREVFEACAQEGCSYYMIANYTALQPVQEELTRLSKESLLSHEGLDSDSSGQDIEVED